MNKKFCRCISCFLVYFSIMKEIGDDDNSKTQYKFDINAQLIIKVSKKGKTRLTDKSENKKEVQMHQSVVMPEKKMMMEKRTFVTMCQLNQAVECRHFTPVETRI